MGRGHSRCRASWRLSTTAGQTGVYPEAGLSKKRGRSGYRRVQDRCLQGAVSSVLGGIYEQDFLDCSMGGRPGRGAHHAVATPHEVIGTRKVGWVYEADLKNFFGSLDHGWVECFMSERVGDPRILTLIRRWLKAGVMEDEQWLETTEGTPQGGSISVLISNVYLHYALDLWVEKVVKPRLKGEVYYIRYVDDFILGFQYREDARRFERVLSKRLEKFSLSLEPSKARLVRFGRFASEGARQRGEKLHTVYFLGFTFFCDKNRLGSFKVGVKTEKSRLKRSFDKLKLTLRGNRHQPLQFQIGRLNAFLTGHYNYYGITGNYGALKNVYYAAIKFWCKTLSSRSQSGRMNWEKYRKILKHY